jgi:hypothetical protein
MKYKKELVTTDSGTIVEGFVRQDEDWNGWALPLFNFENAMKLVNAKDFQLEYSEETDSVNERFNPDYFDSEEDCISWGGGFNKEIGEKVYAIGTGYYCWSVIER